MKRRTPAWAVFLILCGVFFCFSLSAWAQTGTIGDLIVQVLESTSLIPIETATVVLRESPAVAYIVPYLGEGFYHVTVPDGIYSLQVFAVGFEPLIQPDVVVLPFEITLVTVHLDLALIDNTVFVSIPLQGTSANLITNGITVSQSGTPVVTPPPVLIGSTYVVTGIPSGNFDISSDSLAYDIQTDNVTLTTDEFRAVQLPATSKSSLPGNVAGTVVFEGGSTEVPGARILLTHLDTGTIVEVFANATGFFSVAGTTVGPVELQAFEVTAGLGDPAGASIPIEVEIPSNDTVEPPPVLEVDSDFTPGPINVWVDFAYGDKKLGLFSRPYDTLAEAISNLDDGGTLLLKGDTSISSTPEILTLSKPMTIQAIGGTVRIGAPASRRRLPGGFFSL